MKSQPTTVRNAEPAVAHASTILKPPSFGATTAELVHAHRDRRERDAVVEVLEAAARLLQVELHLGELVLDRERGRHVVGPLQELQQLRLDRSQLADPGVQVDELLRDVLAALFERLDLAELPQARERAVVALGGDPKDERALGDPLAAALRGKRLDDEAAEGIGDRVRLTHLVLEAPLREPETEARGLHDLRPHLRDRRGRDRTVARLRSVRRARLDGAFRGACRRRSSRPRFPSRNCMRSGRARVRVGRAAPASSSLPPCAP